MYTFAGLLELGHGFFNHKSKAETHQAIHRLMDEYIFSVVIKYFKEEKRTRVCVLYRYFQSN